MSLGCYGGLGGRVKTPNIDQLATAGIVYNNFHVNPMCSPTRAALLTGRNHHSVGVGSIMELASGAPGYNGRIPKEAAMLPAVLRADGYSTMALGKWHLTPVEDITPVGPFDLWPLGQGFGRFYGFLRAEVDQYRPELTEDNHSLAGPGSQTNRRYHLSEDLVDHADHLGRRAPGGRAEAGPFFATWLSAQCTSRTRFGPNGRTVTGALLQTAGTWYAAKPSKRRSTLG